MTHQFRSLPHCSFHLGRLCTTKSLKGSQSRAFFVAVDGIVAACATFVAGAVLQPFGLKPDENPCPGSRGTRYSSCSIVCYRKRDFRSAGTGHEFRKQRAPRRAAGERCRFCQARHRPRACPAAAGHAGGMRQERVETNGRNGLARRPGR